MTTRTPLSLRRLSTTQLGLTVATLLLLVAVLALAIVTYLNANAARRAFEAGYLLTDLANIERGLYRLHVSVDTELKSPIFNAQPLTEQAARIAARVTALLGDASDLPDFEPDGSNPAALGGIPSGLPRSAIGRDAGAVRRRQRAPGRIAAGHGACCVSAVRG